MELTYGQKVRLAQLKEACAVTLKLGSDSLYYGIALKELRLTIAAYFHPSKDTQSALEQFSEHC